MTRPRFELVFFDVDSTLVTIEGIDVLGEGDPEIVRLTEAAMNGEIPLEEAYEKRLARIRPSAGRIEKLAKQYQSSITSGGVETIETLRSAGVDVHLVTAGIEQAVIPLAEVLGIPRRAVHAVPLLFGDDGAYAGFDTGSPLTRAGGKETVVLNVRARSHGKAAFVGDGATDLEAKEAVDRFIGFGGVKARDRVKEEADFFVLGPSLLDVLPLLIGESQ